VIQQRGWAGAEGGEVVCVLLVEALLPSDEVEAGRLQAQGVRGSQLHRARMALHEKLSPVSENTHPGGKVGVPGGSASRVRVRAASGASPKAGASAGRRLQQEGMQRQFGEAESRREVLPSVPGDVSLTGPRAA
jgi:hypothetical protein